jgi:hypothetical protein
MNKKRKRQIDRFCEQRGYKMQPQQKPPFKLRFKVWLNSIMRRLHLTKKVLWLKPPQMRSDKYFKRKIKKAIKRR